MKTFNTFGPVNPEEHYVVSRAEELADFIKRVKLGRYIVIFAPRQTGKTTFFQWALDALATDTSETYFPIELNFEVYEDYAASEFYASLYKRIYEEIKYVFQKRSIAPSEALNQFLESTKLTDHIAMLEFFQEFANFLGDEKLVLIIDEFDGIPQDAFRGFLRSLRSIYVQRSMRKCPYSVGIVGVKNVMQLNLDRSISPSKTSSICPTSHLNRSTSCWHSIQMKSVKRLLRKSLKHSISKLPDNPSSSTDSHRF